MKVPKRSCRVCVWVILCSVVMTFSFTIYVTSVNSQVSRESVSFLARPGLLAAAPDEGVVNKDREVLERVDDKIVKPRSKISFENVTKPWFQEFPMDEYLKSNISFFTKRSKRITSLPSTYRINAGSICETGDTTLLILIPSVVGDVEVRKDIRNTWASSIYDSTHQQRGLVKLVFFFGESALNKGQLASIKTESNEFGDIVTIDMTDSYANLSLKVASMINWSDKVCGSAKFVLKVDVDTYLNVPLMLGLLETLRDYIPSSACTIGFRHVYHQPLALHTGRWAIPISIYPLNVFPRYNYGHSYVLTRVAVDRIVSSFPFFPIVNNEDAFVTGIMSLVSNITRVHSPAFAHLFLKQTYRDVESNRFVTSIHRKENLLDIWNQVTHHNATEAYI